MFNILPGSRPYAKPTRRLVCHNRLGSTVGVALGVSFPLWQSPSNETGWVDGLRLHFVALLSRLLSSKSTIFSRFGGSGTFGFSRLIHQARHNSMSGRLAPLEEFLTHLALHDMTLRVAF